MSDIVERLRGPRTEQGGLWPHPNLHDEAADTIEALRAENARLQEKLNGMLQCSEAYDAMAKLCSDTEWALNEKIEALRAENAKLRETLKPFAHLQRLEWKGTMFENGRDDDAVFYHHATGTSLTLGDFRAARAAMGETE